MSSHTVTQHTSSVQNSSSHESSSSTASAYSSARQPGRRHINIMVWPSTYIECSSYHCAGTAVVGILVLVISLMFAGRRRSAGSPVGVKKPRQYDQPQRQRKMSFLKRAGDKYGYASAPSGPIDTWRQREYPSLIPPIAVADGQNLDTIASSASDIEPEVYLDYAGSALPSKSQMEQILSDHMMSGVLANPHSTGPAASRTRLLVERAKKVVMDHFNANPGKSYGIGERENELTGDYHPGYDMIFTSGTTESLRIIAESFQWFPNESIERSRSCKCSCHTKSEEAHIGRGHISSKKRKSTLLYPRNCHTSVIGMREPVKERGADFRCVSLAEINNASVEDFQNWANHSGAEKQKHTNNSCDCCDDPIDGANNLLVLPVECNFGGDRPSNIPHITRIARNSCKGLHSAFHWFVMLDLAKAASTGPVDLCALDPDFACLSFYKLFGEPTGLGVLFVKKTSMMVLEDPLAMTSRTGTRERGRKQTKYFGGGSVDVVLAGQDFVHPRSEPSILSSFVHGTVHFRGIASLIHGFDEIQRVGGMQKISLHSTCLAEEFVQKLNRLKHSNGRPVCIVYGAWSSYVRSGDASHGPTVAFNVVRHDGSVVGYNEVSSLAALSKPPIQLRTGCFCNPGACQEALGLTDEEIQNNYYISGHVCGDKKDIINGGPTGAIRASFGKDSIWEDLDALIMFLRNKFAGEVPGRKLFRPETQVDLKDQTLKRNGAARCNISEIFVFPIKSCAAMKVMSWKIDRRSGRLLYDREFALVDSSGAAMRLHSFPSMGQIFPSIDLQNGILNISAPGCSDLVISLDENVNSSSCDGGHIRVCGNKACAKVWGGDEVSDWFSSYIGIQCWLVRHNATDLNDKESCDDRSVATATNLGPIPSLSEKERSSIAFANDAALLLLSQNSIDILNEILKSQGSQQVVSRHFRPNLVVKINETGKNQSRLFNCNLENPEDSWSRVDLQGKHMSLVNRGYCARCQMVDIDPTSGMKGKTLRALSEYRRKGGKIVFGIFLGLDPATSHDYVDEETVDNNNFEWITEGDVLCCGHF